MDLHSELESWDFAGNPQLLGLAHQGCLMDACDIEGLEVTRLLETVGSGFES